MSSLCVRNNGLAGPADSKGRGAIDLWRIEPWCDVGIIPGAQAPRVVSFQGFVLAGVYPLWKDVGAQAKCARQLAQTRCPVSILHSFKDEHCNPVTHSCYWEQILLAHDGLNYGGRSPNFKVWTTADTHERLESILLGDAESEVFKAIWTHALQITGQRFQFYSC